MKEDVKAVCAMGLACCIWGLSALYYRAIDHIPPLEVLSHRTLWAACFIGILLRIEGRIVAVPLRQIWVVMAASVLISVNWFLFIYAVQIGAVAQTSLGYYMFPLVAVVLGALFLREELSRMQWAAVILAGLAVVILSIGQGQLPWVSVMLALTFGLYGLVKKPLSLGPKQSVFWEVLLLFPLALIWLLGVHFLGWRGVVDAQGGWFGTGWNTLLLMFSGVLTGGPLVLMAYAMKRLRLATVGLVQYVNPTLQFILATLIFMEPFGGEHLLAFGLIWLGLGIYSWEALRQEK
ncbi:permease [Amylibacter marinus]|uniref:Permease n=1 Tax=Amylibacter marinus TaxID=1475483 RepID=A0ABQ5VU88_9RHOB|nr:EamA family transporter RarD [Amylibacter marinus]GLQ34731.1 permease [Amylibacter marinus]